MKLGKRISKEIFYRFCEVKIKVCQTLWSQTYKIPEKIYEILYSECLFLQNRISVVLGRKWDHMIGYTYYIQEDESS